MKIVLIRHGRPDEEDTARPHDPPLRADGWQQARAVGALLVREGVTRIVASPLLRAQQTAKPLAERLGMPIHTDEGWSEADRNLARYRSTETLRAQGDTEWQRFLLDPVSYLGDDPRRFRAAVLGALESTIAEGHRDAVVAVFAHGLPINVVLSHALGLDQITHFKVGYGSITRLRVLDARKIGVVSINESGHHAWPEQVTA